MASEPRHTDPPPIAEGLQLSNSNISIYCLNRHNGGPNTLFMDTSVRKVGLKELWTLKWHRDYDIAGPWTKAGGAIRSDWPEWMQQYEEF